MLKDYESLGILGMKIIKLNYFFYKQLIIYLNIYIVFYQIERPTILMLDFNTNTQHVVEVPIKSKL